MPVCPVQGQWRCVQSWHLFQIASSLPELTSRAVLCLRRQGCATEELIAVLSGQWGLWVQECAKNEDAALVQGVVASVSQSSKKERRAAKVKERGAVHVAVVFSLCVAVMAARESLLQGKCIQRVRSEVERVDEFIARCDSRRLGERAVLFRELATFLDVSRKMRAWHWRLTKLGSLPTSWDFGERSPRLRWWS